MKKYINQYSNTELTSRRLKLKMRDKIEAIEVKCSNCGRTQIIYIPKEDIPDCPDCRKKMVIKELLDEGKAF